MSEVVLCDMYTGFMAYVPRGAAASGATGKGWAREILQMRRTEGPRAVRSMLQYARYGQYDHHTAPSDSMALPGLPR